jgi:hypothetical protein
LVKQVALLLNQAVLSFNQAVLLVKQVALLLNQAVLSFNQAVLWISQVVLLLKQAVLHHQFKQVVRHLQAKAVSLY